MNVNRNRTGSSAVPLGLCARCWRDSNNVGPATSCRSSSTDGFSGCPKDGQDQQDRWFWRLPCPGSSTRCNVSSAAMDHWATVAKSPRGVDRWSRNRGHRLHRHRCVRVWRWVDPWYWLQLLWKIRRWATLEAGRGGWASKVQAIVSDCLAHCRFLQSLIDCPSWIHLPDRYYWLRPHELEPGCEPEVPGCRNWGGPERLELQRRRQLLQTSVAADRAMDCLLGCYRCLHPTRPKVPDWVSPSWSVGSGGQDCESQPRRIKDWPMAKRLKSVS